MADVFIPTKDDWSAFENRIIRKIEDKIEQTGRSDVRIYTGKDLERLLQSSPNTIKKFREEGLSFIRISSGEYRYDAKDLLSFLNKHKYNHLVDLIDNNLSK